MLNFFNILDTYFLDFPVLIQWIFITCNLYFFTFYHEMIFLILIIMGFLNLLILFVEDYNIFNYKIQNDLSIIILNKSINSFMVYNDEGIIIMINDNFKKLFQNSNYDKPQFINITNFLNSLSVEMKDNFKQNINLCHSTDRVIKYNTNIHKKNYQLNFEKIIYDNQNLYLLSCDLTMDNKSLLPTDMNKDLWSKLINESQDIHILLDDNFKILMINNKFLQIVQKNFEDIKYNYFFDIIDDKYKTMMSNDNLLQGKIIINNQMYIYHKQKINNYYWIKFINNDHLLPHKDDINETLQESINNVFHSCPLGIIVYKDNKILYINDIFQKMLSEKIYNINEIFNETILNNLPSRYNPIQGDPFLDINNDNGIIKNIIKKIRIFPTIKNDIVTLYILDLTYFYHQEQQLFHAQRLMTTGEILSGIIHDLNNYLMPILGYTENIFSKINIYDPIYNSMIHLQDSALRATNLIKYLLNMSRKNLPQNQNINHVNLKIAELLRSMAKVITKNIEIKFKQGTDVEGVMLAEVFFEQILTNLLINSRDSIGEKNAENYKGLIYITTELLINYENQKDYIKIIIYDNGNGIPSINLKKIFDPFFTTKDKNGMGLGLSTVKKIIEDHKGYINIVSVDKISTEITILLPAAKNTQEEVTNNNYGPSPSLELNTGTILLIEDEQSIRRLLKENLTKNGYKVLESENGTSGLEVLNNYNDKIDILISDVMLPDMSVVNVVEKIKEKHPHIGLILSSGTTEDQVEDIVQNKFHYTFLHKPFPLKTILSTVKSLIHI